MNEEKRIELEQACYFEAGRFIAAADFGVELSETITPLKKEPFFWEITYDNTLVNQLPLDDQRVIKWAGPVARSLYRCGMDLDKWKDPKISEPVFILNEEGGENRASMEMAMEILERRIEDLKGKAAQDIQSAMRSNE